jgi:hypothetical protein
MRNPQHLAYERHPLATDALPSEGPDFADRLGKLLRVIRRNLTPEEWAQLGEIVTQADPAEDEDRYDPGTAHIKNAAGDPSKLVAPRGAEDARHFAAMFPEAARIGRETGYGSDVAGQPLPPKPRSSGSSASMEEMFPDAGRIK